MLPDPSSRRFQSRSRPRWRCLPAPPPRSARIRAGPGCLHRRAWQSRALRVRSSHPPRQQRAAKASPAEPPRQDYRRHCLRIHRPRAPRELRHLASHEGARSPSPSGSSNRGNVQRQSWSARITRSRSGRASRNGHARHRARPSPDPAHIDPDDSRIAPMNRRYPRRSRQDAYAASRLCPAPTALRPASGPDLPRRANRARSQPDTLKSPMDHENRRSHECNPPVSQPRVPPKRQVATHRRFPRCSSRRAWAETASRSLPRRVLYPPTGCRSDTYTGGPSLTCSRTRQALPTPPEPRHTCDPA